MSNVRCQDLKPTDTMPPTVPSVLRRPFMNLCLGTQARRHHHKQLLTGGQRDVKHLPGTVQQFDAHTANINPTMWSGWILTTNPR
ncbi:hypothetical protein B0H19DRAFT_1182291 [Mycena capillaripes]|nr:hypothetical protein B0H19DRAFT_1182291 [Mycena capillaripes]